MFPLRLLCCSLSISEWCNHRHALLPECASLSSLQPYKWARREQNIGGTWESYENWPIQHMVRSNTFKHTNRGTILSLFWRTPSTASPAAAKEASILLPQQPPTKIIEDLRRLYGSAMVVSLEGCIHAASLNYGSAIVAHACWNNIFAIFCDFAWLYKFLRVLQSGSIKYHRNPSSPPAVQSKLVSFKGSVSSSSSIGSPNRLCTLTTSPTLELAKLGVADACWCLLVQDLPPKMPTLLRRYRMRTYIIRKPTKYIILYDCCTFHVTFIIPLCHRDLFFGRLAEPHEHALPGLCRCAAFHRYNQTGCPLKPTPALASLPQE